MGISYTAHVGTNGIVASIDHIGRVNSLVDLGRALEAHGLDVLIVEQGSGGPGFWVFIDTEKEKGA